MLDANNKATEIYHSILLKSNNALDYLLSRGLNKQVLINSKIGFADGDISIINLLKSNNLKFEHLATLDGKTDYFKNRIIMPVISLGYTRLFTSRSLDNRPPIHLHQRGKIEYFFNEDVLFGAKYVLIVESPICCLTLKQNGINAIARLGNRNGDLDKIGQNTNVYIVPDIDSHRAGEREAIKFGALLRSKGRNFIKLVYLSDDYSEKTDVNSYFMKHNLGDFKNLAKNAVDIADHRTLDDTSFTETLDALNQKKIKKSIEYELGSDLNFAKHLNIEDEIGRYCTVIQHGTLYKCVCPFHQDTTPSLVIYAANKSWFCFSCNIGGDIIEFVKRIEEVEFREALAIIVDRNKTK